MPEFRHSPNYRWQVSNIAFCNFAVSCPSVRWRCFRCFRGTSRQRLLTSAVGALIHMLSQPKPVSSATAQVDLEAEGKELFELKEARRVAGILAGSWRASINQGTSKATFARGCFKSAGERRIYFSCPPTVNDSNNCKRD